ncbi:MAG: hypothetical protein FK734_08790 [Asgard group archaeon]|nr:hypothetical protein [Asgard group archaeon]
MTDFVSIKRNLTTEKERLERLEQILKQKLNDSVKEIETALSFLEKSEENLKQLEQNLNDRKRDEINLENQKKDLMGEINSIKENIERLNISIKDEEEKISSLNQDLTLLGSKITAIRDELAKNESSIVEMKSINRSKILERDELKERMDRKLVESQQALAELKIEEEKDMKTSPIIDFLLKEVRIDIPEVDILATLAYRKQAMGLEELKNAVSKTPPVIILKALRNLDSKGIVKFDERLDTIEIIVPLV